MSMRSLLTLTMISATGFGLPGCVPTQHVVQDRSVPHRLSRAADVYVLERRPDGSSVEEREHYDAGSVIAAPEVVDSATQQQPAKPVEGTP